MEIVTLLEAAHLELQSAERRLALATQALADFAMKRAGNACGGDAASEIGGKTG